MGFESLSDFVHHSRPEGVPASGAIQAEQIEAPRIVRRPTVQIRGEAAPLAAFDLPTFEPTGRDTTTRAQGIIAEARETAEQMIDQARAMRDAEIEAARQEGYNAGFAEGVAAADREAAGLIDTAEQIAANVASERERLLEQAEGDMVALAIGIAEKLVCAAIEVDPERVVDVCRGAIRKAFQRDTLTVLAHPDDLAMLRAAGPAIQDSLGGIRQLDFVEERRLQRGSVIVRTPAGEIDATFDSKADKVSQGLREAVEARRADRRGAAATDTDADAPAAADSGSDEQGYDIAA